MAGWGSVDSTTVLSEDDLADVRSAVTDIAARWKDLGISLGIHISELNAILLANPQSPSECLSKMLSLWLKQNYNVERFGKPTWNGLVEAVGDPVGGNNHPLAQTIAKEHPGAPDTRHRKLESQKHPSLHSQKGEQLTATGNFTHPQYMRVMVSNYQPLQTVFAVAESEYHTREIKKDEQFAPTVTIVDTATQQILDCLLLLHDEKPPEVNSRTLFCYIAVELDVHGSHSYPLYHMDSKPCKESKLPLTFCFHQPDTICYIQMSLHSIVDSEGVEYMYHSEDCTCIVQIIDRDQRGVVRIKEPLLLRYTGPLTTELYHNLAQHFERLSGNPQVLQQLAREVTSAMVNDDITVIALCWEALIDIQGKHNYNEGLLRTAWEMASRLTCENGLLLQGRVLRHLAHFHCVLQNYEKALDYISFAKERLSVAAPSIETASVIYTETQVHMHRISSPPLPEEFSQLYESTERNYDLLFQHSQYMEEYEKYRLYLFATEKAKFHLRSVLITDELPPQEYWPSVDDLKKANLCLEKAALHESKLPDQANEYKGNYYLALSDLHLWKQQYPKATEYAKMAKHLFTGGVKVTWLSINRPEERLKLLMKNMQDDEEIISGMDMATQNIGEWRTAQKVPKETDEEKLVRHSYEREMRYGHILTSLAKVLLFGIAGSGKTSVTAILLGDDPPQYRISTPLMIRPVQVIIVLIEKLIKWEKKTQDEVLKIIAEIIRSRETCSQLHGSDSESQQSDSESQDTDSKSQQRYSGLLEIQTDLHNYQPKLSHSEQVQPMEDQALSFRLPQTPPSSKSEFDSLLKSIVKEDVFLSLIHNCQPPPVPILKQKWLYIIDSGGQPEFHNMLSVFVQKTTVCIFVFKVHEGLDDYPPVEFYDDDGSPGGPSHCSRLTNRQIFQQFMYTMRSFKCQENGKPPRIVLLATHRDHIEKSALPKLLNQRHKQLKEIALPQFKGQLIYCDQQLEKFIFTMNAKQPDKSDRDTANKIREVITNQCPGEEVEIPLRWYNLDHHSRKISNGLNRKVLSREEYWSIAKQLNIDEGSCEGALNFFNSLNTIFYFPKSLPNLVFLDPQILLDKFSELVVKNYQMKQEHKSDQLSTAQPMLPEKYHFQFRDFAQVTKELLDEFAEHYHPPMFTSKELMILFEELLIFGKLREGVWFVPSILPYMKEEEVEQYRLSKEGALVISFPHGGPQNGIFCSTISFLLSNENTSPCPWKVLENSGNPKCLKRNVVLFSVKGFPGGVTLIEKWTYFEVHISTDTDLEKHLWQLVYEAVFNGLAKAVKTHHYSDNDNAPQATIICPNNHISTPHPATINCEGKWTCTKYSMCFGQISAETIPWLFLLKQQVEPVITQQPHHQGSNQGQSSGGTDASLTLQNIDQLLTEVLDWNTLGTKLDLPDYCLGEIKIDYHAYGTRRQRKEMISKWLQSDTEASWSRLASALEKMGNKTVAKNIWSQYVPGYKRSYLGGTGCRLPHEDIKHFGRHDKRYRKHDRERRYDRSRERDLEKRQHSHSHSRGREKRRSYMKQKHETQERDEYHDRDRDREHDRERCERLRERDLEKQQHSHSHSRGREKRRSYMKQKHETQERDEYHDRDRDREHDRERRYDRSRERDLEKRQHSHSHSRGREKRRSYMKQKHETQERDEYHDRDRDREHDRERRYDRSRERDLEKRQHSHSHSRGREKRRSYMKQKHETQERDEYHDRDRDREHDRERRYDRSRERDLEKRQHSHSHSRGREKRRRQGIG